MKKNTKTLSQLLEANNNRLLSDQQYYQARIAGTSQKVASKMTHQEMYDNKHLYFSDDGTATELQLAYIQKTWNVELDTEISFRQATRLISEKIMMDEHDERFARIDTEKKEYFKNLKRKENQIKRTVTLYDDEF